MSDLFLQDFPRVSCEGMVERGSIDVLRMGRKMVVYRCRKIGIGPVWHGFSRPSILAKRRGDLDAGVEPLIAHETVTAKQFAPLRC